MHPCIYTPPSMVVIQYEVALKLTGNNKLDLRNAGIYGLEKKTNNF